MNWTLSEFRTVSDLKQIVLWKCDTPYLRWDRLRFRDIYTCWKWKQWQYWIKNHRSTLFKPFFFVAKKVGEIQQETKPTQWRHVTEKENTAEIIGRGTTGQDLKNNELWCQGPTFFLKEESKWPNVNSEYSSDSEMRKSKQYSWNRNVTQLMKTLGWTPYSTRNGHIWFVFKHG